MTQHTRTYTTATGTNKSERKKKESNLYTIHIISFQGLEFTKLLVGAMLDKKER